MKQFRLVLFDLGNVLVRFTPGLFSQSLGLEDKTIRSVYEESMRDLTNRYESGNCSTEEYFQLLSASFDNRFDIAALQSAFKSVLTYPIPGMEELVRRVSARNPAALVSNTNAMHFTDILPRIPALKYLAKRYLSYQVGAIKPSAAFYEHILRNETTDPGEMLFIDDVGLNIEAANHAGMEGVMFTNAAELKVVLEKFELI